MALKTSIQFLISSSLLSFVLQAYCDSSSFRSIISLPPSPSSSTESPSNAPESSFSVPSSSPSPSTHANGPSISKRRGAPAIYDSPSSSPSQVPIGSPTTAMSPQQSDSTPSPSTSNQELSSVESPSNTPESSLSSPSPSSYAKGPSASKRRSVSAIYNPPSSSARELKTKIKEYRAFFNFAMAETNKLMNEPTLSASEKHGLQVCQEGYASGISDLDDIMQAIESQDMTTINTVFEGFKDSAETCMHAFEQDQSDNRPPPKKITGLIKSELLINNACQSLANKLPLKSN